MADTKIIDAVATAPVAADAGVSVSHQNVPVKIDGTALAGMLSKIAASQQQASVSYVNPAEYVLAAGNRMQDMYNRYNRLRKLGGLLQGKSFNDPIPPEVQIENVTITFKLASDTETHEAKILNVACVGDIAQLLSTEMGTIILALQQEANSLTELSKSTADTAQKARNAWESSNKDRKIVLAGQAGSVTTAAGTSAAPVVGEVSLTNEN